MTTQIDFNPCHEPAWLGLVADWRTGYIFAQICPDCQGSEVAEHEARRLRYNVVHVQCPKHTAEAIATITGDHTEECVALLVLEPARVFSCP